MEENTHFECDIPACIESRETTFWANSRVIQKLKAENQNLKDKLANRDLNLADRDRRIDALESDLKLISLIAAHVRVVERNQ